MSPFDTPMRRLARGVRAHGVVRLAAKALRSAVFPRGSKRDKLWAYWLRPWLLALGRASRTELPTPQIRIWNSPAARIFGERDAVGSILVLKLDHIGDFLLAAPAFAALRRNFPEAEITLVCATWNAGLARRSGLFDRVQTFDFFPAKPDARRRAPADPRGLAAIGLPAVDLAIDLRVDEDTRGLLDCISARCKAGYYSRLMPSDMAIVLPQVRLDPADGAGILAHQRGLMLRLVATVVAYFDPLGDSYRLLDRVSAGHDVTAARLKQGWRAPVVAVSTSSGRAIKNWPLENFAAICRWILQELGGTVLLLGGAEQQRDAALLARRMASPNLVDFVGRLPIEQSFGLVKHADLFLGNDSGLTHAAAALRIPTVALYSGMDPIAAWGPLGPRVTAIRAAVPCSPCHLTYLTDCLHAHICMRAIPVDTVKQAMLRRLPAADWAGRRSDQPVVAAQQSGRRSRAAAMLSAGRLEDRE